jgi:cyanate lyase
MDILIKAKKKSGLKYSDITKITGLHKSVISKVLRGVTYASLAVYIKVGKALGLSKEEIQKAWKKEQREKIEAEIKASNEQEI